MAGSYELISRREEAMSEIALKKARALEIIGGTAERYAKRLCPVDTGNLRNSITHQQLNENTELIGTNVEYAPHVELGTRFMAERPFLRPAAQNHGDEYRAIMESEMKS